MPCIITGFLPKSLSPLTPTRVSKMLNVFSIVAVISRSSTVVCTLPRLQIVLPLLRYYRVLPCSHGAFLLLFPTQRQRFLQRQVHLSDCSRMHRVLPVQQG